MGATEWHLKGTGYEFCNCDFGCGCNFGGFPNSKDGSCRAFVGTHILEGACGGLNLSGVKFGAIIEWPKAIHEGNGKAVFIGDSATTDAQIDALAQIFSGKLGGLPWELVGPTFEVVALEKAPIEIEGEGRKSIFRVKGLAEGRGDTFKNPVTGEDHLTTVVLDEGFIWKRGECGEGSFRAKAGGLELAFNKTNWIFYQFDWSNTAPKASAA
jgi:hypothetical protein